jgi:hypothetical protein
MTRAYRWVRLKLYCSRDPGKVGMTGVLTRNAWDGCAEHLIMLKAAKGLQEAEKDSDWRDHTPTLIVYCCPTRSREGCMLMISACSTSLMAAFDAISKKAWSLCFAAFDNEAWLHSIILLLLSTL